ncbi:MAG: response regulator transcription factor [Treponema sp.]|jgi:DNA-binding NarL/FixJ family response regulator|nr:response regulator transcription factor [Treponema sp.]
MISVVIIDGGDGQFASVLPPWNGIQIIGLGKDEYDTLMLVESKKPDAVVISLCNGGISCVALVPLLKRKSPRTAIVLYTTERGVKAVCDALDSGVSGYLLKPQDKDKLPATIKIACLGGWYVSPDIFGPPHTFIELLNRGRSLVSGQKPHSRNAKLQEPPSLPVGISRTELRIMGRIGRAQSNKEIAEQLALTQGTVRNYISSAMRKAGLQNRTQIAIYALRNGLTSLP